MRVSVEVLRQAADHAAFQCQATACVEQLPRRLDLPELDHAIDGDAVEPGPYRAIVVRRILVPAARCEVEGMETAIRWIQCRYAPREHQSSPGVGRDPGRVGGGHHVQREQHIGPQGMVGDALRGDVIRNRHCPLHSARRDEQLREAVCSARRPARQRSAAA